MKSHPRAFAALWFGVTGLIPGILWFLPAMIKRGSYTAFHIWVFLLFPAVAAAMSGFLIGAVLLDPERIKSMGRALLRGALGILGTGC